MRFGSPRFERSLSVLLLTVAAVLLAGCPARAEPPLERHEFFGVEMAVPIRVILYAPDRESAEAAHQAVMERFAQLNDIMSDYDAQSEVRKLCEQGGPDSDPVAVSDDLWRVLRYSQQLARETDGAFDVTVGPVVRLWRRARRAERLPQSDRLAEALASVGYDHVQLMPVDRQVRLTKSEMRIDLGAVAKGYAVDESLELLRQRGITSALVDAGGDVGLGAAPPDKEGWTVGIAPLEGDGPPSRLLTVAHRAVATSGDTWQMVEIDGRRYSHIVDPRTGLGLTDHSSVTVVAPTAMEADGLASAISVLGPKAGLELVEDRTDVAVLIMRKPGAQLEVYESDRFREVPSRPAPPRRQ